MLILGTCNPAGEGGTYNGLYLKQDELQALVDSREMVGVPVKTEHSGQGVGTVVSTFLGKDGALQCVMDVPEDSVRSSLAGGFVRDGVAAELSLGYTVDVAHSSGKDSSGKEESVKKLTAGRKQVLEVSLVRKGARHGCHILAYQDEGRPVVVMAGTGGQEGQEGQGEGGDAGAWAAFDMRG